MTPGTSRGITLIELVVAMTVGLVILAAATPFVLSGGRSNEQQSATRQVQAGMHSAAEMLLVGIRGARAVLPSSSSTRLEMESPPLSVPCGGDSIWVEASPTGLECGPLGGGTVRVLAAEVEAIDLSYGIDADENGRPDLFADAPSPDDFEHAVAVRFRLEVRHAEGRGRSAADPEFVAVLRRLVLQRITLAN